MTSTIPPELTKIILIEDDIPYANTLKRALENETDFKVLACFHSAEDALKPNAKWQEANCALVDLELPKAPGNQIVMHLSKSYPEINIVILTAYQDAHATLQVIQSGAHGYMMKDKPLEGIITELRNLRNGGAPLDPRAARTIISSLRLEREKETIAQLSRREIEILELINKGHQYKEIAEQLKISPHTVHSHIKRIYRRLSVSNRRLALQKAQILGIIER